MSEIDEGPYVAVAREAPSRGKAFSLSPHVDEFLRHTVARGVPKLIGLRVYHRRQQRNDFAAFGLSLRVRAHSGRSRPTARRSFFGIVLPRHDRYGSSIGPMPLSPCSLLDLQQWLARVVLHSLILTIGAGIGRFQ